MILKNPDHVYMTYISLSPKRWNTKIHIGRVREFYFRTFCTNTPTSEDFLPIISGDIPRAQICKLCLKRSGEEYGDE